MDTCALCSMVADLKVSQVVNGQMGAQASMVKDVFKQPPPWFGEGSG